MTTPAKERPLERVVASTIEEAIERIAEVLAELRDYVGSKHS